MSQLRQEYITNKENQDKIVTEAAEKWLENNVVIINEKINRNSVNRLVSSIAKFEETFQPFETKVPTITTIIDGCEENLQMVLMGKAGDKKTSEVLEYLSYVYNLFSTFFSKDLPIILKAKLFKIARENPEIRLDSLTRGGFNAEAAMKSFAHGITPSPEEMKLIGKILKAKNIPNIDAKQIASELMSLSYNDLVELGTVGKVPLTTTPKTLDEEDVVVSEQWLKEQRLFLVEASLEDLGQKIGMLKNVVAQLKSPTLTKSVNDLHSKLLQFQGSSAGEQLKQAVSQVKDVAGGGQNASVADMFKTPGGKLTKQANMAIELFNALGKAWPKVQPLVDKDQPTEQDLLSIKNILLKAVSGGMLKKAAQAFNVVTQPFPGLDQETVVNALTSPPGAVQEQVTSTEPTQQAQSSEGTSDVATQLANLKTAMTALNQFATKSSAMPASPSQPAQGSTETKSDNSQPQPGTDTANTKDNKEKPLTSGDTTGGTGLANAIVNDAMTAMGASQESTKKTLAKAIAAIQKAGYKITK